MSGYGFVVSASRPEVAKGKVVYSVPVEIVAES